jgi:hypothetical protein
MYFISPVFHSTAHDTTYRGHFIPANTRILPLLSEIHSDQAHFPNPDMFDPDRKVRTSPQSPVTIMFNVQFCVLIAAHGRRLQCFSCKSVATKSTVIDPRQGYMGSLKMKKIGRGMGLIMH